jgi:hypothetical protein
MRLLDFLNLPNPSCPLYGHNKMLASQLWYRVHSVFCEFTVNSHIVVSSHHTIAMKYHLEHDERQRKWKKCYVGLRILGCFEEYHTKARFSLTLGGGGYIYIKMMIKKCVHWILLYLNIIILDCSCTSTSSIKMPECMNMCTLAMLNIPFSVLICALRT